MTIKFLRKTLPASALYLAVIISFVAGISATLFIIRKYYNQTELTHYDMYLRLSDNAFSAINCVMQNQSNEESESPTEMMFSADSIDRVEIASGNWGAYGLAIASASWKKFKVEKIALYGQQIGGKSATGLYLADKGHYLSLAGDTYISGNTYLPKLGARKAYIDGKSFKYKNVVDGILNESAENLPAISDKLKRTIEERIFADPSGTDSLLAMGEINTNKLTNSFRNKTIRLYSEGEIILDNEELTGNIIVQSEIRIILTRKCRLENIICAAPLIWVDDRFEGKVQLIATDTLDIGKEVILHYPSSLIIAGIDRSSATIIIGEDSHIEGTVLAYTGMPSTDATLLIMDNAEIKGTVYCAGKVQHKGRVYGSLYCNIFFLQTRQGYYENHLLNAWIDPSGLEPEYAGGAVFGSKTDFPVQKIIQWVN